MSDTPQKRSRGFGAVQVLIAMAAIGLFVAWFVPLRPAGLTVSYTTDGVVVQTADGRRTTLTEGQVVGAGESVVLPAGGAVTLEAPDGHHVSLFDSTELAVNNASATYLGGKVRTEADLRTGSARVSGTARERTSLDIGLPAGLAGVRGTDFGMQVVGTQTLLSVHEGLVEVADATGGTTPLGAGQGVVLTPQGATVATLPAAPTILSPATATVVDSVGTQLTWSAVAGAAAYVVEIALDQDFRAMLQRVQATTEALDIPALAEDSPVFVRVRALSAEGLDGAPSAPLPIDVRLRLAQGLQLQGGGDILGSIAQYEAAVVNYPNDVTLLRNLAFAYYLSEQYAEARPRYEAALALDSADVDTRLELGRVYFYVAEYDAAIEQYEAILEVSPDDPDALWGLGDAYRVTGRTAEALPLVERALALQPDHPYAAETLRQLRNE